MRELEVSDGLAISTCRSTCSMVEIYTLSVFWVIYGDTKVRRIADRSSKRQCKGLLQELRCDPVSEQGSHQQTGSAPLACILEQPFAHLEYVKSRPHSWCPE